MNREILFKAKRKYDGEWVYGDAIHEPIGMSIRHVKNGMSVRVPVDPDTLCQDTGLTDKNGKKIWENDIVKHKDSQCFGAIRWYCGDYVGWCVDDVHDYEQQFSIDMFNDCEVIGNIFDNPELLEVEK